MSYTIDRRYRNGARSGRLAAMSALAALAACTRLFPPAEEPVTTAPIRSARDVIREMHKAYAGKWYSTLRFRQTNTFYTQSGREEKSQWIENLSVPGKLRIDFEPLSSKSGLLIVDNRVTTFDNGRRIDSRRSIQPILTLTADVYAIPPAVTLRRLDSLGVDLARFRTDRLDRNRVYVIGARNEDDAQSNQVWIDADRLLLVRFIQRETRGSRTIVTDTRLRDYKDVGGFPVAHEHVATRDGKPYFREEYTRVRVNEAIPSRYFDAARWGSVRPASD
jgi:hypothetical protein